MAYNLMGDTKRKARKAKTRRLLKRYDEEHEYFVMKGTYPPSMHDEIEADYQRARKALIEHMNGV